jgi:hypothetical protein
MSNPEPREDIQQCFAQETTAKALARYQDFCAEVCAIRAAEEQSDEAHEGDDQ